MLQRILIIIDASVPEQTLQDCRSLASQFAGFLSEPVGLATLPKTRLRLARATLMAVGGAQYVEELQPPALVAAAPMSAAEFVWRDDGRPDWSEMWTGFCELALYGGPPHRGDEMALKAHEDVAVDPESEMIAEIRRGIWETTGLFAEPAGPGWVSITCHSRKMAAWLCASIILENVEARCDEERLLLPASPDFELKNEVKSVITVLAKTNHYWEAHVQAQEAAAGIAAQVR